MPKVITRSSSGTLSSSDREQLSTLSEMLASKVLKRSTNQGDSGYGSSSYLERTEAISLYSDHTFVWRKESFSSVSSGGLSMPSEQKRSTSGQWTAQIVEGKPALVLWNGDELVTWWHARSGGSGIQYLDQDRWERYKME
jgi:hypothetical protein